MLRVFVQLQNLPPLSGLSQNRLTSVFLSRNTRYEPKFCFIDAASEIDDINLPPLPRSQLPPIPSFPSSAHSLVPKLHPLPRSQAPPTPSFPSSSLGTEAIITHYGTDAGISVKKNSFSFLGQLHGILMSAIPPLCELLSPFYQLKLMVSLIF